MNDEIALVDLDDRITGYALKADVHRDGLLHRAFSIFITNGSEMLLQSRAIDETGYVQPTKTELREIRGVNSIYHNNAIQTWWINGSGEAENVEVS